VTRIPPLPPDAPRATAAVYQRFEDVTQDGRLVLEAIPNALGPAVWRAIIGRDPSAKELFARGIVPVLSRFVIEGEPGPLSANAAVEAEGACRLARSEDGRLVLDMWADLRAARGRTYDLAPQSGERVLVGRAYGEHVLTRPFAPPGERRVRELDFPGAPAVMGSRPATPPPESIVALPDGATPLDGEMRADPVPLTFGLMHTDSNMHVNSLVYVRLFEEAALRRFAELGRGVNVLGTTLDILYRKPCFAGQTMRVVQRAFELGGRLGVVAVLVEGASGAPAPATQPSAGQPGEALSAARPHVYVQMTFA
jgi:hypothetical protein